MLVRLLGAKEQGDLSPYRDLDPAAWYNRELSAAVSLGIFNGVSATQMAPMRSITRQEAFTVLARAFGLYPQNRRAYTRFRDGEKVQPYARDAVSALAEVGCVTGYDTGYLKPRDPISRQEVAALFYKLLDQICDDPQELGEAKLEALTDAAMRAAIRREYAGTTLFLIAQRVSSVRECDQILVLDQGRTAGLGNHEQLMRGCPLYAQISRIQNGEKGGDGE